MKVILNTVKLQRKSLFKPVHLCYLAYIWAFTSSDEQLGLAGLSDDVADANPNQANSSGHEALTLWFLRFISVDLDQNKRVARIPWPNEQGQFIYNKEVGLWGLLLL